jgi:hypothetical protein
MVVDDSLDYRQPYADPFEFVGPVQPLERAKEVLGIAHVETRTVVPDEIHSFSPDILASDFDDCPFPTPCELKGIGEQVRKDSFEQCRIANSVRQVTDLNIHLSAFPFPGQFLKGMINDVS